MQLLAVLEEEQQAEAEREARMRQMQGAPEERRRLEKVFGLQRAKASARIMRLTEEHELVLAQRMAGLGLIR